MAAGFIDLRLQCAAALDQIDNQHHNRNDEQNMNESTHRVGADQSKEPEHQQDHEYCPQHNVPFGWVTCSFVGWGSVALIEIKISAQIAILVRSRNGRHYSFSTTARRFQSAASSLRRADS